ncbi:hypothetical protein GCM10009798_38080 [Nocardioides panacihumi]|uniref:Putative zinc-finger domain-containing protein n=1 Tax=Nocardioides panacihumi TaxID=400774 RepID=A0ABN2RQM9_9ACTN
MSAVWHVDATALAAYAEGRCTPVAGASVEAHLMRCRSCTAGLRGLMPEEPVERAWRAVRAHVEEPRAGAIERLLRLVGVSAESARLLGAVPAFQGAWVLGLFSITVFAGVAAVFAGDLGMSLFLIVAPLAPVAGVAASFGGDADPAHELEVATPYSSLRLLLLRTAGVLATSVPVAMLLGLGLPGPAWLAVAWLTPALTGIAITLALSPYVGTTTTAAVIGAAWSLGVLMADRAGEPETVVEPAMQLVLAALAVIALVHLVLNHPTLDPAGRNS